MSAHQPELFIGVTSWNSELFLGHCLRAAKRTTTGIAPRIVVLDNCSTDHSVTIARDLGVEVVVQSCTQPVALNRLLAMSRSRYTLLIHADVILLSANWFDICRSKMNAQVALVSPEDIGCGPFSRAFGAGMPESSFMLFDTLAARRPRVRLWPRWHRIPLPHRTMDFYGPHITHRLPQRLQEHGYSWHAMNVHVSDLVSPPIYQPPFQPQVWTDELGSLRYGLGNFYSLDGEITHYHNWYDRVPHDVEPDSIRTTGSNGQGFPLAYVQRYTQNFLRDLTQGSLVVPPAIVSGRRPKAL
jgi:glycosyltransferase involved in cell wall biosynthesis